MPQMTRRNLLGGIGIGATTALAGCTGSAQTSASSTQQGGDDDDYDYITTVEPTKIGDGEDVSNGIRVVLTDFAVSKHSAAEEILVVTDEDDSDEDAITGKSTIPRTTDVTIPIESASNAESIIVRDNAERELASHPV